LSSLLGAPPATNVVEGRPATGRYAGQLPQFDWTGLAGDYRRSSGWHRFHLKRWQYVAIGGDEVFIGVAIVDLGWSSTAFAYVFDRAGRKLVADISRTGLPGLGAIVSDRPGEGAASSFRVPGARWEFASSGRQRYQLSVTSRKLKIEAEIDASSAAPFLLALGPLGRKGCAHGTQKSSALRVSGSATAGEHRYDLGACVASLDYSNGLLARSTDWKWASAHSPELGFNLQQGYFGEHENALWLDGQLIALGAARFEYDRARPMASWRVSTEDGLLSMNFVPEGVRSEHKNLLLASSHYVQPIGCFSGWVKAAPDAPQRPVSRLLGVTEDHRAKW
jgi:hypothetical protein